MPNWVRNIIHIEGDPEQTQKLFEAIKNDAFGLGTIDFNKIIPMPESLNIESGNRTDKGLEIYRDFITVFTLAGTLNMDKLLNPPPASEAAFLEKRSDVDPSIFELGKKAYQNFLRYGAKDWNDWCRANWGTKWNACGYLSEIDYSHMGCLVFDTAWSPPFPILEKLSDMFPALRFTHEWANEDLGMDCGKAFYYQGISCDEYYLDGSKEAEEFAASAWDNAETEGIKMEGIT